MENKQTIMPTQDFETELAIARKEGKIIAVKQMLKAGKSFVLAFGAFAITKKFSDSQAIAITMGVLAGASEFINFDFSNIFQQGGQYVQSVSQNMQER